MFRCRFPGFGSRPRSAARAPSTRLRLEQLDAREVPAILFSSGAVDVEGTSQNDTATITLGLAPASADTQTINVTLVSRNAAGTEVGRESAWFYASTVTRVEFHGGAGDDVLSAPVFLRVFAFGDGGDDRMSGTGELLGGEGDDQLFAMGSNTLLDGGSGGDILFGSDYADILRGADGNDVLHGGRGLDTLWGGTGDDWMEGGAGADMMSGEDGIDTMYGGAGDDRLLGGIGSDRIYGEGGINVLRGGAGDDRMFGGAGDDRMFGEDGNDTMFGALGNDWLEGGFGSDLLVGDGWVPQAGDGNDVLLGGDGADTLYGTGGNDWLNPGLDADRDSMDGGPGADMYVRTGVIYRSDPSVHYDLDLVWVGDHEAWDHTIFGGFFEVG